jgi:hypothetical protein
MSNTLKLLAFVCLAWLVPVCGAAEQVSTSLTPKPKIGFQGFAAISSNFPSASESFEAAGLGTKPIEIGAGAQITNIWRSLFVQVSASKWDQTGERTFIDASGNRFPLDIPLSVNATYVDVGVGWKFGNASGQIGRRLIPYLGGGFGHVGYRESSPFAEADDDVSEGFKSSHLFGGVEVRVLRWMSVAGDIRFRFVPNLLGTGGTSAVIGDSDFGGLAAGFRLIAGR